MPEDVRARTAANRRVLAGLVSELDAARLDTPSLCAGWTCRDVLAHLVMQVELSTPRLLVEVVRDLGRTGRTFDRLARARSARPVPDLVRRLRDGSEAHTARVFGGSLSPFADSCIHLRDVAVPLGLPTTPPVDDWARVLAFLATPGARASGFLPRGRTDGLRLEASDSGWTNGSGELVAGPSEALALSLTGRAGSLDHLAGPGVAILRRRVGAAVG